MITVKELKSLLENIPDDTMVSAYEGESTGLNLTYGDAIGWIEATPEDEPDNPNKHSLSELIKAGLRILEKASSTR